MEAISHTHARLYLRELMHAHTCEMGTDSKASRVRDHTLAYHDTAISTSPPVP
jgi:hypothetical protein